jgi:hypothetical protein
LRVYNRYIFLIATLLLLTAVILSLIGVNRLDLYYSIYLIEALVVTELYIYLNPRAKKGLNTVIYLLFGGFLLIVVWEVVRILFGI